MRLLLDTHAFLWWLDGDRRLPARVRAVIGDPANEVLVSAASVWEITTKARLGKLPRATEVAADVPACIYYTLKPGMAEALRRMIEQCSTLEVRTSAAAEHVSREAQGGFTIHCADGRTVDVDDLVLASSGPATARLLEELPGTGAQRAALAGIEFHAARLALHTDPIYAPANPDHWSFLNCAVQGGYCEASMWLASVLPLAPPETAAKVWKSWITHRQQRPTEILHEAEFSHMLPTPATLRAQIALRALQGRDGLWFAGGYLLPYDSQETALRSALGVALGLRVISARGRALLEAAEEERRTGRDLGFP